MIEFLVALDTYGKDEVTKLFWNWINEYLSHLEGVCFFKYPILIVECHN